MEKQNTQRLRSRLLALLPDLTDSAQQIAQSEGKEATCDHYKMAAELIAQKNQNFRRLELTSYDYPTKVVYALGVGRNPHLKEVSFELYFMNEVPKVGKVYVIRSEHLRRIKDVDTLGIVDVEGK